VFDREHDFRGDGGVGDQAVVGADGDREVVVEHQAQRMPGHGFQVRHGLEVAGEADLDGDALAGDVFGEMQDIGLGVFFRLVLDHLVGEEPGAVADAVGVAVGDGLENGFGSVGFAGMHRLADEVAVRVLEGVLVVAGREMPFSAPARSKPTTGKPSSWPAPRRRGRVRARRRRRPVWAARRA
jgi:hypothetical protein